MSTLADVRAAFAARVTPEQRSWLAEAAASVRADPTTLRTLFAEVGRRFGRGYLYEDDAGVTAWTTADAGGVLLLAAAGDALRAEIGVLYHGGDAEERRCVLRALSVLPVGDLGVALVEDAVRTNDPRLVAAALGPYGLDRLDGDALAHAVLKCVFLGVPIHRIEGLARRVSPQLSRMLASYAHERIAAGREVPTEVWPLIARFPPIAELDAITAEFAAQPPVHRVGANASPGTNGSRPARIFEPHIHMTSRTTDDYEAMATAGVLALVEPSFWLGQPRTCAGSFVDYFNALLGWEPFRAAQFGIAHHCTIALNPKEANDPGLRREVVDLLPRYLVKDRVVAVGEVGYDAMTAAEDEAFAAQVDLARGHDLPVLVHTPHRDKLAGTRRSLDLLAGAGLPMERVLIDHNNEVTVAEVARTGCWMGFSIYPETKMNETRMVRILQRYGTERVIVNSAADWGRCDPLKVARTASAMRAAGFSADEVDRVVWRNPVAFYGQSGRLALDEVPVEPDAVYAGNSVRRGQAVDGGES